MDDFASALLVRMIRHSLRAQGIATAQTVDVDPAGPRVGATDKRLLIESVLRTHGPRPLLRVGESIDEFESTPVARLFDAANSPGELIERWLRIERYFHARHRTRLIASGPNFVSMQHFAIAGPPPTAGEDIVVASVMQGLLTRLGATGVTLRVWNAAGRWQQPSTDGSDTSRWRLTWACFRRIVRDQAIAASPPPRAANGRELPHGLARRLFQEAARDPGARRRLSHYAAQEGMSARSLQRRLAESGWTLQGIVAAMRLQVAADLLSRSDMPIALVGLFAGYSDQPHFQRAFQKGLGPTPKTYRQLSRATKRHVGQ